MFQRSIQYGEEADQIHPGLCPRRSEYPAHCGGIRGKNGAAYHCGVPAPFPLTASAGILKRARYFITLAGSALDRPDDPERIRSGLADQEGLQLPLFEF
ncbi:MAG: hypothetical protein LBT13_07635 [Treponema sp.]|nr:hypothetical protein [Treponema sp.]